MTWDGGSPELPPLWGPGMETLLGPARRSADEPLEDRHRDIAATLRPASRRSCSACCATCTRTGLTRCVWPAAWRSTAS